MSTTVIILLTLSVSSTVIFGFWAFTKSLDFGIEFNWQAVVAGMSFLTTVLLLVK